MNYGTAAAAAATQDPLTHCARPGIETMPLHQPESLQLGFLIHCDTPGMPAFGTFIDMI